MNSHSLSTTSHLFLPMLSGMSRVHSGRWKLPGSKPSACFLWRKLQLGIHWPIWRSHCLQRARARFARYGGSGGHSTNGLTLQMEGKEGRKQWFGCQLHTAVGGYPQMVSLILGYSICECAYLFIVCWLWPLLLCVIMMITIDYC